MFYANENTTCCYCGKTITIGEPVKWSRKSAGGKYHPTCEPARIIYVPSGVSAAPVPAAPVPAAPVQPAPLPVIMPALPAPVLPVIAPPAIIDEAYSLPDFQMLKESSPWWNVLAQCTRVLDRILLVGPPSSGKSTTGMKTLTIRHRITMTQNTSREDMCGMFHLISGATVWVDGPVTKAMRTGAPVLIDEIDRCGPEVESLMYSVIDDHPHLTLPNGELVTAAAGFKVIMTTNNPPDMLEAAVVDRMQAIILAYAPHEDALSGLSEAEAQVVRNYYKAIVQPRITLNPSVRRMRAFRTLVDAKMLANVAARVVFGNVAAPELMSVIANVAAAEAK